MTRHQCHVRKISHVPCTNYQATTVRVFLYLRDQFSDLVNQFSILAFPALPLLAINRTEFTLFIGPFIPDPHSIFFQVFDIGFATQEPKQLINNAAEMDFFSGNQRESILKIKPHLIAKTTLCASAGTVIFMNTIIYYMLKQAE